MSGLRAVREDGSVIEIPRHIESAGGEVLRAYEAAAWASYPYPPPITGATPVTIVTHEEPAHE